MALRPFTIADCRYLPMGALGALACLTAFAACIFQLDDVVVPPSQVDGGNPDISVQPDAWGDGAGGGENDAGTDAGAQDGAGGHVVDAACEAGARNCSDGGLLECVNGQWQVSACPSYQRECSEGRCVPPSCVGLPSTCGYTGDSDCCGSAELPAGGFQRADEAGVHDAAVTAFRLDLFEVTVGRFRKFVEHYGLPEASAGKDLPCWEGWRSEWTGYLPDSGAALVAEVASHCDSDGGTYQPDSGENAELPINCVSWQVALAFCVWDGGRLPTEAEWQYAAAGGNDGRTYPWSDASPEASVTSEYATYLASGVQMPTRVGAKHLGDGKWGHADLAGNVAEWVLDPYFADYGDCTGCCLDTRLPAAPPNSVHPVRGGHFRGGAELLRTSDRSLQAQMNQKPRWYGFRCARPTH